MEGKLENGKEYHITLDMKLLGPAKNLRATLGIITSDGNRYNWLVSADNPAPGKYYTYEGLFSFEYTGDLERVFLYFETADDSKGDYPDYLVDEVQIREYDGSYSIPEGPRLRDIQDALTIGSPGIFYQDSALRGLPGLEFSSSQVMCYPAWGRWSDSLTYTYNLDAFSENVHRLKKDGYKVGAHMLLGWNKYFPAWFYTSDFPPDTLDKIMEDWLRAIITHNGHDTLVDYWNVLNETISWDGRGGYWDTTDIENACELQRLGFEPDVSGLTGTRNINSRHPVYIRKAFEYARSHTSKVLELRDAGFEFPENGAKYHAFYQLVRHLLNMGTPLDAIGFQSHLDLGREYNWKGYTANMRRYRDLGLEVYVTEADIGDTQKEWSEEKAAEQKTRYYQLTEAAIKGGASDFQVWGYKDGDTHWRRGENPLLFTMYEEVKPAYYGIQEALMDMDHMIHWDFEEIVGDTILNSVYGRTNGYLDARILTEELPGFQGNSLSISGSGIRSDSFPQPIDGNFTLSLFLNTEESDSMNLVLMETHSGDSITLYLKQGRVWFSVAGESPETVDQAKGISDGQWHHIALQRDSFTYVLSVDDARDSLEAAIPGIFRIRLCGPEFKGLIDEVKVYDHLTDSSTILRQKLPRAPTITFNRIYATGIRTKWMDESSSESGFVMERKLDAGSWIVLDTLPSDMETFLDPDATTDGTYQYRLKAYNRFGSSEYRYTEPKTIAKDPTSMVSREDSPFSMFPNPSEEAIHIRLYGTVHQAAFELFDLQGRKILNKKVGNNDIISLNRCIKGIYLYRLTIDKQLYTGKLVKK
jgi:endo-1,4-beta-xylanase